MAKIEFGSGASGGNDLTVKSGGAIAIQTGGQITGVRIEQKAIQINTALVTATQASGIIAGTAIAFQYGGTIKKVTLMTGSNVAGHATANSGIALRNVGTTATGTAVVATLTLTTGNACTANVAKDITLQATGATFTANQTMLIYRTKNSTGQTFPASTFLIEYAVAPT